jgi:hypothetical protein
MSDLTLHSFYHCKSLENFQIEINGYDVKYGPSRGQYQYDWSCTCQGFKFKRNCKHIKAAKEKHCGWDQFVDNKEPVNGCCPNCGGDIDSKLVGI